MVASRNVIDAAEQHKQIVIRNRRQGRKKWCDNFLFENFILSFIPGEIWRFCIRMAGKSLEKAETEGIVVLQLE